MWLSFQKKRRDRQLDKHRDRQLDKQTDNLSDKVWKARANKQLDSQIYRYTNTYIVKSAYTFRVNEIRLGAVNNTDAAFVIVYFCPQRENKMCVKNRPMLVLGQQQHFVVLLFLEVKLYIETWKQSKKGQSSVLNLFFMLSYIVMIYIYIKVHKQFNQVLR